MTTYGLTLAWFRNGRLDIQQLEFPTLDDAKQAHARAVFEGVFCADVTDPQDNILWEYQIGKGPARRVEVAR